MFALVLLAMFTSNGENVESKQLFDAIYLCAKYQHCLEDECLVLDQRIEKGGNTGAIAKKIIKKSRKFNGCSCE